MHVQNHNLLDDEDIVVDEEDMDGCEENSENSVHALTNENYIVSPCLVVAYALARTVCIDFVNELSETSKDGKSVEKSETSTNVEKIQSKGDPTYV
ncbi:hypothetical protein V6N13_093802 [Hibiscus sabdariffa]